MPSSELTEWIAYYTLEPFGQERDNWHAAQLASILVNVNRRKNSPPVSTQDFMYVDRKTTSIEKTQQFFAGLKRRAVGKKNGKD